MTDNNTRNEDNTPEECKMENTNVIVEPIVTNDEMKSSITNEEKWK